MSFRVKLRIKSVNPCYPVKPVPAALAFPPIKTDPELLRFLYEAAKQAMPPQINPWRIQWPSPGLPDPRFNPMSTGAPPRVPSTMICNGSAH